MTHVKQVRRTALGAVFSLLTAGLMLATVSAPADAAAITVTSDQIRPNEATYPGWHQGYPQGALNAAITLGGLSLRGQSQVINGYADNSNTGLAMNGVNADVDDLLGATYDVIAGQAYFQLPLFIDDDGDAETAPIFATLRPAAAHTDNTPIAAGDAWVTSKAFGGFEANEPHPLSALIAAVHQHAYKTIAFGVLTNAGESATVSSITFHGDTYTFQAPSVTSTTVRNTDVKPVENADTYTSWHQGYAGATVRQQVYGRGLVLAGRSQVIKGYPNNSATLDAVNANLQFVLPAASYTVAAGSDPVFLQIPVRFDNGQGLQFTTLRNTGQGPGEHNVALTDQWQSSKQLGDIAANTDAPLSDIIAALGDYKVIGVGFLTNVGTQGTVSRLFFGNDDVKFTDPIPAPTSTSEVKGRDIRPDESTYPGWHQGSATGHATVATDSHVLDLGATKSQVIYGYADNSSDLATSNVDLVKALTTASYTVTAGKVYFQVPVFTEDLDNPNATVFATLRPSAPAAIGTNTIDIGQLWQSSKPIGGIAANTPVLLGDLLSALKTTKVIAFGVFSDDGDNGKVSDLTWNGVRYTFTGNQSPVTADKVAATTVNRAIGVQLSGTDPDGDTVTFALAGQPANGGAAATGPNGATLIFVPHTGFVGQTTVDFTASDGNGGVTSGKVDITVGKAATRLALHSSTGGARKTFLRVTPKAPGGVVNGAQVEIRRAGNRVALGVVSQGYVRLQVGNRLKPGTYKFNVFYRGTSSSTAVNGSLKVVVKK